MSGYYDKDELKQQLEVEDIFALVDMFHGEPEYTDKGFIAQTICHNVPDEGSRKLYYYENTKLFHCYTGCWNDSFDIFELVVKVKKIQDNQTWSLYDAMSYVADYFGLGESKRPEEVNLTDWKLLQRYDYKRPKQFYPLTLKQLDKYDDNILEMFTHPIISSWEKEGISREVCHRNDIAYYPAYDQIIIPHYDINHRLIGIRGRTLIEQEAQRFGKYRPITVNKKTYTHPLSANLYNINNSKDNMRRARTAVVFESEKATMQYASYYGHDKDISVACCGSSISTFQIDLLKYIGVNNVIIAFDRQFQKIGDDEFYKLKNKLINLSKKYGKDLNISVIFDKDMITPYKASPTDCGKEIFEKLLNERIRIGENDLKC